MYWKTAVHLMADKKQREGDRKEPGARYPQDPPHDLLPLTMFCVLKFPEPAKSGPLAEDQVLNT
jgi:hypothetical protein